MEFVHASGRVVNGRPGAFSRCRTKACPREQARETPEIGAHILDDGIHNKGLPKTEPKRKASPYRCDVPHRPEYQ